MSDRLENAKRHVEFLASEECEGRAPGTSGGLLARSYVTERFEELELVPSGTDGLLQPIPTIGGANIIGQIFGKGERYVLVAAHYDHLGVHFDRVHPGADDNASGVAVLLDVARQLQERRSELGASVLLCSFDAEEPPYFYTSDMGSVWFVDNPTVPMDQIDLMVCLDLVGHPLGPPDVHNEVRNSLFVLGIEKAGLGQVVDNASTDELSLRRLNGDVIPPLSDHYAFEQAGIPYAFFTAGRDRHYHTPQDTAEKMDYQRLLHLADAVTRLVVEVSQTQERVSYDPSATDDVATLDTLLTLGFHLADRAPKGDRALRLAKRLYSKALRGALSPIDRGSLRILIESFERAIA